MTKQKSGSHPKNQHYVPKFLLKNFSSNNHSIWTFDKHAFNKKWNNIKERSIENVASEDFLYDKIENCKEGSYEYVFREVETKVAPIISKLIKEPNIKTLNTEAKECISLFVAMQLSRTKEALNRAKKFNDDFFNNIFKFVAATTQIENFDFLKRDHKELWHASLDNSKEFSSFLLTPIPQTSA